MDSTFRNGIFSTILTLLFLVGLALFVVNFYPPNQNPIDGLKISHDELLSTFGVGLNSTPNPNTQVMISKNDTDIISIKEPSPHFIDSPSFFNILLDSYKQTISIIVYLVIGIAIGYFTSQILNPKSAILVAVSKQTQVPKLTFKQVGLRVILFMLLYIYFLHGYTARLYQAIWLCSDGPLWIGKIKKIMETGIHL